MPDKAEYKPHYIVLRFSALGDVAMVLSQLRRVAEAMPDASFTLVARPFMATMTEFAPLGNLSAYPFKPEQDGSVRGLLALALRLHKLYPRAVIVDLHDVLRTKVLRCAFRILGHKVVSLQKPRAERKRLFSRPEQSAKVPRELYIYPMVYRYFDTLKRATGIALQTETDPLPKIDKKSKYLIGLAPYAQHKGKMLPSETIRGLLKLLTDEGRYEIVLYGAPGKETEQNALLASEFANVRLTKAGKLIEEIEEIASLDLMISMDSANMHLASLAETPVLSLWGATHVAAGFLGYRQREEDALGIDLTCRPCSAYGQKPCRREDYPCLNISPEMIYKKVVELTPVH
ncbi:MAG: glycosyltransferase family 9 protein [Porphyromonas sp.]|nr:glycosyltransferase family 9 protein [Porphyromonas sp.]